MKVQRKKIDLGRSPLLDSLGIALALGLLLFPDRSSAGMEIAYIPKLGYFAPTDKQQVLPEDSLPGREYRFAAGPGYGGAIEIRYVYRDCGVALGPEILRYRYKTTYTETVAGDVQFPATTQQRTSESDVSAGVLSLKAMCLVGERTRFFLGVGDGSASNSVAGNRISYNNDFRQYGVAAEYGRGRVRAYGELRYFFNRPGQALYSRYDGSGYSALVGVSVSLQAPLAR